MRSQTNRGAKPVAVSRIGSRRQVVIPQVVLDELQLSEGDFLEVTAQAGRVSLRPAKTADAEDALTPQEAKQVRRGLKQIKEGRTRPWSQVKHDLGL